MTWVPPSRASQAQPSWKALAGGPRLAVPDAGCVHRMAPLRSSCSQPTEVFNLHPGIANAEQKKRNQKAKLRAELLRQSGENPEGFVRRRVVGLSTRVLYAKAVEPFMEKMLKLNVDIDDLVALDCALEKEMTHSFFQGRSVQDVRVLLYAVCWRISKKAASLPLARATLKGFAREEPDQAKEGVTWEEMVLMSEFLMDTDRESDTIAAAAVLVHFDCYQRPAALLKLCCKDVHRPASGRVASPLRTWTLVFHPSTEAGFSKTRTQDDTTAVGMTAARHLWLGGLCAALHQSGGREGPHALMFPCSRGQYAEALRRSSSALGFARVTPHLLRHGGASFDAISGGTHEAIRLRGQWRHPSSCARYLKFGQYIRRRSSLCAKEMSRVACADQRLQKLLPGKVRNTSLKVVL